MIKNSFFTLLLLSTILMTSCDRAKLENSDLLNNKPNVVVTFSILEDILRNIAKDKVNITTIVNRDSDPHMYEPKPSMLKTIKKANLIIRNGIGFEGWLDRLLKINNLSINIITASSGIIPKYIQDVNDHKKIDPHAWHDINNIIIYTRNITRALCILDKENADFYQANEKKYKNDLIALDQWIHRSFAQLNMPQINILNAHDAFYYYGKRYNINFHPLVGISTEEEPSIKNMTKLTKMIRSHKIQAIFIEHNLNSRMIKQLSDETGMKIGGVLYADSLSNSDDANTYIKMMRWNTNTIIKALGKNMQL